MNNNPGEPSDPLDQFQEAFSLDQTPGNPGKQNIVIFKITSSGVTMQIQVARAKAAEIIEGLGLDAGAMRSNNNTYTLNVTLSPTMILVLLQALSQAKLQDDIIAGLTGEITDLKSRIPNYIPDGKDLFKMGGDENITYNDLWQKLRTEEGIQELIQKLGDTEDRGKEALQELHRGKIPQELENTVQFEWIPSEREGRNTAKLREALGDSFNPSQSISNLYKLWEKNATYIGKNRMIEYCIRAYIAGVQFQP